MTPVARNKVRTTASRTPRVGANKRAGQPVPSGLDAGAVMKAHPAFGALIARTKSRLAIFDARALLRAPARHVWDQGSPRRNQSPSARCAIARMWDDVGRRGANRTVSLSARAYPVAVGEAGIGWDTDDLTRAPRPDTARPAPESTMAPIPASVRATSQADQASEISSALLA